MKTRKILAWILFPLTMWYAIVVAIRNICFSLGILKERSHRATTICVGNLCTGGAGKTPHADYLLKLLGQEHRTASLSRGYKRSTTGFVEAGAETTVAEIGDEPFLLKKRNPEVCVAVCEDRNKGIETLLSKPEPPQIIILDDAYQHRYVKPSVNILLTEFDNPYFRDHILPFGNLREFRIGAHRANYIIVTKTPENINPVEKYAFIQKIKALPHQQVFFSTIEYQEPVALNEDNAPMQLSDFQNILLVTGIANPKPLVDKLSASTNVRHLPFADHHKFEKEDFELIANTFAQLPEGENAIITTEKDAVRIVDNTNYQHIAHLPIYCLPIGIRFLGNDGEKLEETLAKTVRENDYYLKHSV